MNKSGRYKEQWNNYFEGDIEIWSYFGYQYHSYLITKYIVSQLPIPENGKVIQLGTGLGITVELLCQLFGEDRVIGYDLFNPLNHPNIKFWDTEFEMPPDLKIAYLEIDTGSMSHAEHNRENLLNWGIKNIINRGYILTNKKFIKKIKNIDVIDLEIIDLADFDNPYLWKNPHQSRINTKTIVRILK